MTDDGGWSLVAPQRYAEAGPPHELLRRMRFEEPVSWCEPEGYEGFWAITKHADIQAVSTNPQVFVNSDRIVLNPLSTPPTSLDIKSVLQMDPPEHRAYRQIVSRWFTPKNLRSVEDTMVQSARRLIDKMAAFGPDTTFDFVTEIAAFHPLHLIAHLMGLDEEDEPVILRLTNEVFGSEDPEYEREGGRDAALMEGLTLFGGIMEDRQRTPRDDLASVIANAEIGGERIDAMSVLSYYAILLTAGHETTRSSLAGGLAALSENPGELSKLQADPTLAASATEEIVRWVTPVNHFARTAVEDCEVRDVKVGAGESVALFYVSANRDEDVFEDPFAFRVDRNPNPHLGFGVGEHFCLGSNLARLEIRVFLSELLPRLRSVEIAGEPQHLVSSFASGLKHLPIRCTVA